MILFLGKNVIPPLYHLIVFCYSIYLIAFLKRSSSRSAFYEKLNDACIKRMCFYFILLHKIFQQCIVQGSRNIFGDSQISKASYYYFSQPAESWEKETWVTILMIPYCVISHSSWMRVSSAFWNLFITRKVHKPSGNECHNLKLWSIKTYKVALFKSTFKSSHW